MTLQTTTTTTDRQTDHFTLVYALRVKIMYSICLVLPWSCEKGPMGGAPYLRLKQGGGPTSQASILGTIQTHKAVQIMCDIVG